LKDAQHLKKTSITEMKKASKEAGFSMFGAESGT
tara:strand:- start:1299 stop:1400 length:102 start_codon:yes stop_codon:yes gene_type:complete